MTRLIDADALIEDIRKHSESYFADDFAHEWVDKQQTVDAVPVIRCKDCKYKNKYSYCTLYLNFHHLTADMDYCSDAERKEE